jgi:hypothetical protein
VLVCIRYAPGGDGVRERSVLAAGEHPAAVDRHAAIRNLGCCPAGAAWPCQHVMVDQGHGVAGGRGSHSLRREVLIRMAGTKRIRRHEKQHHASMGK